MIRPRNLRKALRAPLTQPQFMLRQVDPLIPVPAVLAEQNASGDPSLRGT
ncbi:protein of unknown function [Candidatus Hydrogenisulfobacillus filiaventi]|uniref:Uncharacterized protein n=1 Tax=Candidatus Hydrogenisulfobacillus filiaventi TaxID=2707344 RepID=A0A6F8ZCY3_9FIRM|nr:protein of unknown function [Candidatus Hydrogenisulfobacillus filiaventi]